MGLPHRNNVVFYHVRHVQKKWPVPVSGFGPSEDHGAHFGCKVCCLCLWSPRCVIASAVITARQTVVDELQESVARVHCAVGIRELNDKPEWV